MPFLSFQSSARARCQGAAGVALLDGVPSLGRRGIMPRVALLGTMALLMVIVLFAMTSRSGRAASLVDAVTPSAISAGLEPTLDYDLSFATYDASQLANAAIPFVRGPSWTAEPFILAGTEEDRARATTCLASAAWYEAGDDAAGEQAVAQVVVNRLRHPVFPKTVCGVVFQRVSPTGGCQFTFTCDGSFRRVPSIGAWLRARAVAERALSGFVYAPVGTATYYHATSVMPYWSSAFDKIAQIRSHIFYRLRGLLGRPSAFVGHYQGSEQIDPRLIALNQVISGAGGRVLDLAAPAVLSSAAPSAQAPAPAVISIPGADLRGNVIRLVDDEAGQYGLQLDPSAFPGSYAVAALSLCRDKPSCTVMGWLQPKLIPAALPSLTGAMPTLSFLYRRDAAQGVEQLSWNCRQIARTDVKQCLPGTAVNAVASLN